MRENVDALRGLILSEAVMLALGEHVGRQEAHDIVYEAAMTAFETRRPLRDLLLRLLSPEAYIGLAGVFVDRIVAQVA